MRIALSIALAVTLLPLAATAGPPLPSPNAGPPAATRLSPSQFAGQQSILRQQSNQVDDAIAEQQRNATADARKRKKAEASDGEDLILAKGAPVDPAKK